MSEEKTPRELLANRVVKMIREIGGIIDKHVENNEAALDLTCKIHRYADLSGYLCYSTDETINQQYYQETEIWPKCPIKFTGGLENEPEYPLIEVCTLTECSEFDNCWASKTRTPPGGIDLVDFIPEPNPDWPEFRQWLYRNREPTPIFKTEEATNQYYVDLEREYREKGLYP